MRGPGLSYISMNVLASVTKVVYSGEEMEAENMMVAWHKIFSTAFVVFFFHIDSSKESFGILFLIAGKSCRKNFHPQHPLNLIPPTLRHFNLSDTVSLPMYCMYIRNFDTESKSCLHALPTKNQFVPFWRK